MFSPLYPLLKPLTFSGFASETFLLSHPLYRTFEVSIYSSPRRYQMLMMNIVVQNINHAIYSSLR